MESTATRTVTSPDEALRVLRSEPDYTTLVATLRALLSSDASVDIRQPTPSSAQLVNVLVNEIVPHYWAVLHDDDNGDAHSDCALVLSCLRSVLGLNVLTVRLRALLSEVKATGRRRAAPSDTEQQQQQQRLENTVWQLRVVLEVLSGVLADEDAVSQLWRASGSDGTTAGTAAEPAAAPKQPLAQRFLSVLGGGRIVSLAAEAEAVCSDLANEVDKTTVPASLADGKAYSRWLTRALVRWGLQARAVPLELAMCGGLLSKAMRLGYPDVVVATLVTDLLLSTVDGADDVFLALLTQTMHQDQQNIVLGVLRYAAETYFGPTSSSDATTTVDDTAVAAVAGLVSKTTRGSPTRNAYLSSWLLGSPDVGQDHGIAIRRAVIAVIAARSQQAVQTVLTKAVADFSDPLSIQHTPSIVQDSRAQVLLLAAGYVHRTDPREVRHVLRSRAYLALVSNRLGASSFRARFLGMVVGEALSGLVDNGAAKLDFHMDEMDSDEAHWYKGLVHVSDTVGLVDSLRQVEAKRSNTAGGEPKRAQVTPKSRPKPRPKPKTQPQPRQPQKTGFVIEEVDDDGDDDDDIVPYAKPDSDAEDSDDDPTLVRRDKPKAPVYIRDLIAFFRDSENYDKQRLALTTAPVLIRRKATFGTEVQQHALDLVALLVGLQDSYDMDEFQPLRLQSMIALVVAQPHLVVPWMASAFFTGDYSLAQRASLLSALGLGARELAGLDTSEHAAEAAFPSKQLPQRLERLYVSLPNAASTQPGTSASSLKALPSSALDAIAESMTARFLGPMAAQAADEATGPDVLKLASFKTRAAATEKNVKKRTPSRTVQKKTNTAGQTLATVFFTPLAARFQIALQVASSPRGVLFDPGLLALYLKTLAVVLHAAGPSTLALPDMTAELWRLLLGSSVQAHAAGDLLVTHAVLFAVMALLDVNEQRMRELCRNLPREVVQTREWALQVLETMRAGGGGGGVADSDSQETEVQRLAAGTYLQLTEAMESYKNLLLGEMIG